MVLANLIEYIENRFEGSLQNLIYFLIGLAISIIVFLIALLILYLIYHYRYKKNYQKDVIKKETDKHYLKIIDVNKELYNKTYKSLPIKEKFEGIGKIVVEMANDIASLYYPESKDPIFEISIEQLSNFIDYLIVKVDFVVDELLEEKLHFIDVLTNYRTKDIKIGKILELAEKKKEVKAESKNPFSKIKNKFTGLIKKSAYKVANKIGSNIIDDEFELLIDDIGNDLNSLYTDGKFFFNNMSKRQLRLLAKESKKSRKKARKGLDQHDN